MLPRTPWSAVVDEEVCIDRPIVEASKRAVYFSGLFMFLGLATFGPQLLSEKKMNRPCLRSVGMSPVLNRRSRLLEASQFVNC